VSLLVLLAATMSYIPKVDTRGMMASADAGVAHIRAGLNEKRAFAREAKLCCDRCKKQETSANPLQACSRCRSVYKLFLLVIMARLIDGYLHSSVRYSISTQLTKDLVLSFLRHIFGPSLM
jgi:hypothetical protein